MNRTIGGIKPEWCHEVMKLGMVLACIQEMDNPNHPELEKHAKTLMGPRTRGSTTGLGLHDLHESLELTRFNPQSGAIPGCFYYYGQVMLPSRADLDISTEEWNKRCRDLEARWDGRLGAISLNSILNHEHGHKNANLDIVKLRPGPHGPELYLDLPKGEMPKVNIFTVILGPDEHSLGLVVWTWHPGMPLGSIPGHLVDGKLSYKGTDAQLVVTSTPFGPTWNSDYKGWDIQALCWEWVAKHPHTAVKVHNG
jgi:hypothetical protein